MVRRPSSLSQMIGPKKVAAALVLIVIMSLQACSKGPRDQSGAATAAEGSNSETKNSDSAYADTEKQELWIMGSQDAVRERLKDADSAQFRKVGFYSGSGSPIVCGEVNARNGFGGYSGFERFIAKGPKMPAVLASDMTSPAEMTKAWAKLCIKAPSDRS